MPGYRGLKFWINTLGEFGRMSPGREDVLGCVEPGGANEGEDRREEIEALTTPREFTLLERWKHLDICDGRWRTYANIDYMRGGRSAHILCTEFILDPADEWTWEKLAKIAREQHAEFEVMTELRPNEVQVAINFNIFSFSPYLRDLTINRFQAETERLWTANGVCVI